MTQTLDGKVALVTGASSGIGRATALLLAEAGARVALVARRFDRLTAVAQEIEASGGTALVLAGDAADQAFAAGAVKRTCESLGGLDILVNAAGVIQPGRIENADPKTWREVMDVNLFASLHMCSAAVSYMRAKGRGDIVNITSMAGREAGGPFAPYTTSKFAITGMTANLRHEVAQHGIRVCIVEPGATSTDIAEGINDPAYRQGIRDYVGKKGSMQPEDVATAILCVVSLPPRANVQQLTIRPTTETSLT